MNGSHLIGSWRMVSWTRQNVSSGETQDVLGPDPVGYIAYHADGRMMASVFAKDRLSATAEGYEAEEKAALHDSMLCYVAEYTLEEGRVVHHVEKAWNPNWEIDLSRPFTVEGNSLLISGAPNVDPYTGEEVIYEMKFVKVPDRIS